MALYNVEVSTMMVVVAKDEDEAYSVALSNARQSMIDADPDVNVIGLVESRSQLRDSWDEECIPYGGNGNDPIYKYLGG